MTPRRLSFGENSIIIGLFVLTLYNNVTNRRTEVYLLPRKTTTKRWRYQKLN